MSSTLLPKITHHFPELPSQLIIAGMSNTPEEFVKKSLISSGYLSAGILFIIVLFATKTPALWLGVPAIIPVFAGLFLFFMQAPTVKIQKRAKEINREIVYAGRFIVIEIESGVPLYDAMKNLITAYPGIGKYFRDLITKVDFGTAMEDAINETILYSPSEELKKMLWQVLNAINTGGDIHKSLNSVVEQIVREQQIQMKEYAKKLNPLAMFYMMIAVIAPTLGTAMLAIATNFLAVDIGKGALTVIAAGILFIQVMFLQIIRSQRPAVV
ncbi:MAG: type II secretion system F family protein [Nanobdellota archaeon]